MKAIESTGLWRPLGDDVVARDSASPLVRRAELSAENNTARRLHGKHPTTLHSTTHVRPNASIA
jgi:hypothetical protein